MFLGTKIIIWNIQRNRRWCEGIYPMYGTPLIEYYYLRAWASWTHNLQRWPQLHSSLALIPTQSVHKFGMYVGRLSPGEMCIREGSDLVRGSLTPAIHPLVTGGRARTDALKTYRARATCGNLWELWPCVWFVRLEDLIGMLLGVEFKLRLRLFPISLTTSLI